GASPSCKYLFANSSSSHLLRWEYQKNGDCLLFVDADTKPTALSVGMLATENVVEKKTWDQFVEDQSQAKIDFEVLKKGGAPNWPETVQTVVQVDDRPGPFQVDQLTVPFDNPWNDRMRLTGIDFVDSGNEAIVSCWDGTIYRVSGIGETSPVSPISWNRIAVGLFQPLGVKVVDGEIFVTCRDQLVRLHDLNDDGEIDFYENFNSDHQVTEHFHEFAMGLQTDQQGNFYYAKSARHALPAVVPHHGTLLKVSADGKTTEIVANGFRAANGVCINPDGTFVVTDQEGHWNPKNRINWVSVGGFYGNMYGYHDFEDSSDEAMDPPLCWITNSFDRSPGELMWVKSDQWKPIQNRLLNLSYGTGQIFIVPHEKVGNRWQGGMCAFPLPRFPTGIMRGRFSPKDGHLYCCGMFAWAGDQQKDGGLYRVRYTGEEVCLPVDLRASEQGIEIRFSCTLENDSIAAKNFQVKSWDLKRTKQYGSKHYNEKRINVRSARLLPDGKSIELTIPEIRPTWCMEIQYQFQTKSGRQIEGNIHNTIHQLKTKL
ncbi:MAG: heme-binding protein, partial [Planctomycetota bacterium]